MKSHHPLVATAEQLFDRYGFTATGMDRLALAASMSSRTLYKHAGSKTALIAAVLSQRDERFLAQLNVANVDALFQALENWIITEGARGCLFLRAMGETGGDSPEIAEMTRAHKARLFERIQQVVQLEWGSDGGDELAAQIVILLEGATAAAIYRGVEAVATARSIAAQMMQKAIK
jgi:AcrR family transcriptional regulator